MEYTMLEYIQSSGTQYIDIGVKPDDYFDNLIIKFNGNYTSLPTTNEFITGCCVADTNYLLAGYSRAGDDFRLQSGPGGRHVIFEDIKDTNRHTWVLDQPEDSCSIDNTKKTILTRMESMPYNIFIFAMNNSGTAIYNAKFRLYSYQLYDGDTLIRNLVPMLRNSDNKPGLYDLVNRVFYTNQGTGEFTYQRPTIPTPASFITPIYDRTLKDVLEVIELNNKMQTRTYTPEDMTRWQQDLKGALNISDLNRIINNIEYMASLVEADLIHQPVPNIPTSSWYRVLLLNLKSVEDAWMTYSTSPVVPEQPINTYTKLNDIEKILFDLKEIWDINQNAFYYAGDGLYGNDNFLI